MHLGLLSRERIELLWLILRLLLLRWHVAELVDVDGHVCTCEQVGLVWNAGAAIHDERALEADRSSLLLLRMELLLRLVAHHGVEVLHRLLILTRERI